MTMTSPADAAISGAPPAPGRRVVGWLVVADDRRVDVAEAVELRRAEEADVDAPGLQPVGEDLGHADTTESAVSASSPSPIESGSRVGFEPMQPDS